MASKSVLQLLKKVVNIMTGARFKSEFKLIFKALEIWTVLYHHNKYYL